MWRIISHRGNLEGEDLEKENKPEYILKALKKGFDVEVDVFCIKSKLFLGHDEPLYPINRYFLKQRGLWIHCKNIEAIEKLLPDNLNIFCHNKYDFTITTHEYIWVYPGKELTRMSIAVLPESIPDWNIVVAFGICTDYPIKYREMYESSSTL